MIHIRVQYDAQTRTFKLVDKESRTILEGDGVYDMAIPLAVQEETVDESIALRNSAIAYAWTNRN